MGLERMVVWATNYDIRALRESANKLALGASYYTGSIKIQYGRVQADTFLLAELDPVSAMGIANEARYLVYGYATRLHDESIGSN